MASIKNCVLLRRLQSGCDWAEYHSPVILMVHNGIGLTFRDTETSSILCDLTKTAIISMELLQNQIIKIDLKKDSSDVLSSIAFQVKDISIDDCASILQENGFHLNKVAPYIKKSNVQLLPDIDNPEVQQLILQLLLRDDFNGLVDDLEKFLHDFQTNINV